MPAAAEAKFCTVSPAIWARLESVDSPAYDCQLVLETKLMAVLKARCGDMPGKCIGFSGSRPWSRRMA